MTDKDAQGIGETKSSHDNLGLSTEEACQTWAHPGGQRTFYEFFAGGGTARLGLADGWTCLFANDCDKNKANVYRTNFPGGAELAECDVRDLAVTDLPGYADLAWASFPCQDLSAAGAKTGLDGSSSGAFWPFWEQVRRLAADGRAPGTVVLENVVGLLSSDRGRDFSTIVGAVVAAGYRVGALVVDATLFLPHSRKRVFIVAVRADIIIPQGLVGDNASVEWTPNALSQAVTELVPAVRKAWVWWRMPPPEKAPARFEQLLDVDGATAWHRPDQTADLLAILGHHDRERLEAAKESGEPRFGAVTVRTRHDEPGGKTRRANIVFGGPLPCIVMPRSGMARSVVIAADGNSVRTRALTVAEAARFMGIPPTYKLPGAYNAAFRIVGDAIAVPVVRHLAEHLLEPLADAARAAMQATTSWRPRMGANPSVKATKGRGSSVGSFARAKATSLENRGGTGAKGGIKASTVGTTLYLIPDEHRRVRKLAFDKRMSLHALVLDALDRSFAEAGQRPIERYRRNAE